MQLPTLFVPPKFCVSIASSFPLGPFFSFQRENKNSYSKFWRDKQIVLCYVFYWLMLPLLSHSPSYKLQTHCSNQMLANFVASNTEEGFMPKFSWGNRSEREDFPSNVTFEEKTRPIFPRQDS